VPQSIVQPLRRWDPERIGPYTIIGKLGAGAMGQVFLARSTAGRLVAVKTIKVELAEEAGFRARFAREVAAASRVSGVFTAAVIEADPDADLPWVATAYVPAPSLSTLVQLAGPLPVPAVRWLAAGCAEALQSIHGAGLLHRDVKPSNVLVAPDGPRVIDFGIARAAERVQFTSTRGASGTPAYMAPEQARDASQASPASDVFSLGATLVFAATGHAPYEGDTVMDILVRLATEPPDLTGMPEELADLVAPCLQRVPRDRPTDATILGKLGSFVIPAGPGHSYLPDAVMAVIAEYQNAPLVPAVADDDGWGDEFVGGATAGSGVPVAGDDPTSGSHTPLPGFHSLNEADPRRGQATRRGRRREPDAEPSPRPRSRTLLPMWARVLAALALLGGGIGLGIVLQGPGAQAAGPVTAPPPACTAQAPGTAPEICVSQPYGDGYTVYVIHGTGFPRFAPVTVELAGVAVSPDHPVTDLQGTFNYAVDQGHRFFHNGPIPPGAYRVVAMTSGGPRASASFRVNPAANGGPPPGPSGQGGPP